jgi:hypothetical protein
MLLDYAWEEVKMFNIGETVKFFDEFSNKIIIGKIVCKMIIVESNNKNDVGITHYFVQDKIHNIPIIVKEWELAKMEE